jgi:hypothetical protein
VWNDVLHDIRQKIHYRQYSCPTSSVFDTHLFVFVSENIHIRIRIRSYPYSNSNLNQNMKTNIISVISVHIRSITSLALRACLIACIWLSQAHGCNLHVFGCLASLYSLALQMQRFPLGLALEIRKKWVFQQSQALCVQSLVFPNDGLACN